MSDPKEPVPLELDAAFLTPLEPEPSPQKPAAPVPLDVTPLELPLLDLVPLDVGSSMPPPFAAPALQDVRAVSAPFMPPVDDEAPSGVSIARAQSASGSAPVAVAAGASSTGPHVTDLPLVSLEPQQIPEKFAKHTDPTSPVPMRIMAARAMLPMPPRDAVRIVYQLMLDTDPKVAAAARKSFGGLDDRILTAVVGENLPQQILEALCHTLVSRADMIEKVLLNRATPDEGFVYVAEHTEDTATLGIVTENQQRLLRCHDIVRGIRRNPKAMRSDLDKAIDFLVREGVFLEDVPEFEDSFLRLGKGDMLAALKKVQITEDMLSERERAKADELGMSAEDFLMGKGTADLTDEQMEEALAALDDEANPEKKLDFDRDPLTKFPIPIQIKLAMVGSHARAVEALSSSNRMVAGAGIRNPKIKEQDAQKIAKSKSANEDVIRYICANQEWTKAYTIKFALVCNPKTPPSLVTRWLPLMRAQDLRTLSKSKQVPSAVQIMAKRLMNARGPNG